MPIIRIVLMISKAKVYGWWDGVIINLINFIPIVIAFESWLYGFMLINEYVACFFKIILWQWKRDDIRMLYMTTDL